MTRAVVLVLAVLAAGLSLALARTMAHETPIAVLELKERQPGQFLMRWIFSSARGLEPPTASFPEHCALV